MIYYSDSFTDYNNNKLQIRWTKKTWDDHLYKHSEIKDFKTISTLITEALTRPSIVMYGENIGEKKITVRCYYKEHKKDRDQIYYTKVIVGCNYNPFYIKTVFVEWLFWHLVVREKKYNNFKEIWRDPKTYL